MAILLLLSSALFFCLAINAQYDPTVLNAVRREGVDSSLRKYAFLALNSPDHQTSSSSSSSAVYDIPLTPLLSGIRAQAMKLASGESTLTQQAIQFNEFTIPQGAMVDGSGDGGGGGGGGGALLLVYRRIVNFTVYTLPSQYAFAGPVAGVVAYAPQNFTTDDPAMPQLSITFPTPSISATLPLFSSNPNPNLQQQLQCAFFAVNGSFTIAGLSSPPNVCSSTELGDVALILPSPALQSAFPPPQSDQSPQNNQSPQSTTTTSPTSSSSPSSTKTSSSAKPKLHWKLALGATALTLAAMAFCVAVVLSSISLAQRLKAALIARATGNEEALQTSLIGISRAPTAPGMRTKPALEMDMARF